MANKRLIILFCFFFTCAIPSGSFGQISVFDSLSLANFKKFDSKINRTTTELINRVSPSEKYNSWILKYKHSIDDGDYVEDILIKRGKWRKNKNEIDTIKSNTGFIVGCLPSLCYYYIIGFYAANHQLIDNKVEFADFIGNIDNLEELELMVNLNGYRIDTDTLLLGSYFETKLCYYLYLTKYEPSPEKFWSVRACLTKSGKFEVIDERLFKATGRRVIY